ncbi:MAG: ribose 5-phosphate isomerase B [Oscillospiraceae bacterium]|nr:ribose 5-phosphate isomerase B [Oscillospiraceae bacterium]MBQ8979969.1 ribose 5-phosphate isomerase B [Oscillospiraceae bacterium]
MKILLGSDHGGYDLRLEVAKYLEELGHEVVQYGSKGGESVDYPLVAQEVCPKVLAGEGDFGILICGTGIGISIAANKIHGIRAALCTDCYMAEFTRKHNNANVLCMGGRVTGPGTACKIAETFLSNGFEGGRHQRRIDEIE